MKEITIEQLFQFMDKNRYIQITGQVNNEPNNIITIIDKFENTEETYLIIKNK